MMSSEKYTKIFLHYDRHHNEQNRCQEEKNPWGVIKKVFLAQEMLLLKEKTCMYCMDTKYSFLLYYWNIKHCSEKKVLEFLFRLRVIKNSNDSGVKENAERLDYKIYKQNKSLQTIEDHFVVILIVFKQYTLIR